MKYDLEAIKRRLAELERYPAGQYSPAPVAARYELDVAVYRGYIAMEEFTRNLQAGNVSVNAASLPDPAPLAVGYSKSLTICNKHHALQRDCDDCMNSIPAPPIVVQELPAAPPAPKDALDPSQSFRRIPGQEIGRTLRKTGELRITETDIPRIRVNRSAPFIPGILGPETMFDNVHDLDDFEGEELMRKRGKGKWTDKQHEIAKTTDRVVLFRWEMDKRYVADEKDQCVIEVTGVMTQERARRIWEIIQEPVK